MDVMIDIETLAKSQRAVVLSIAAVPFQLNGTGQFPGGVDVNLDVEDQISKGRSMDWDTIKWWVSQPTASSVFNTPRLKVDDALNQLSSLWLQHPSIERVWAKGSAFDIPILETLYSDYGREAPWGFREVRDLRTLIDLAGELLELPIRETPQHAAYPDAAYQIIVAQKAYLHVG